MTNHTTIPFYDRDHLFARATTVYDKIPSAILLGGILQSFLLGYVLGQASKYFMTYRNDDWKKKAFVGILVILSLLQTIIEEFKLWDISVEERSWTHSDFAWSSVAINGCISWLSESFYVRRCWKMTGHNRWVLYSLGVSSAILFATNMSVAVLLPLVIKRLSRHSNIYHGNPQLLTSLTAVFSCWIGGSLFLDLIVTSILITSLWRAKTGFEGSDRVVWSIITLTCETAFLPCISMIVAVVLYHAQSIGNLDLFFVLLSGKLYVYGLLRTLNARDGFRSRLQSKDLGVNRVSLSNWNWDQQGGHGHTQEQDSIANLITEPPKSLDTTRMLPRTPSPTPANSERIEETSTHGISSRVMFSSPQMDSFERGSLHSTLTKKG